MAILQNTTRFRTKAGQKYYLSIDTEFENESYSVYSYDLNSDFTNKTGTLMYTEKLSGLKKGATDDLINDNATLIDSYGSIDFMDSVRNQIINWVLD